MGHTNTFVNFYNVGHSNFKTKTFANTLVISFQLFSNSDYPYFSGTSLFRLLMTQASQISLLSFQQIFVFLFYYYTFFIHLFAYFHFLKIKALIGFTVCKLFLVVLCLCQLNNHYMQLYTLLILLNR